MDGRTEGGTAPLSAFQSLKRPHARVCVRAHTISQGGPAKAGEAAFWEAAAAPEEIERRHVTRHGPPKAPDAMTQTPAGRLNRNQLWARDETRA